MDALQKKPPSAQNNLSYADSKTLAALEPAVVEVLGDDDGDTCRSVYTEPSANRPPDPRLLRRSREPSHAPPRD